jgi:hypothetical protein
LKTRYRERLPTRYPFNTTTFNSMQRIISFAVLFFTISTLYATETIEMKNPIPAAEKLIEQGLHKDALDLLHSWVFDPKSAELDDKDLVPKAVNLVTNSLKKLYQIDEIDEFLESIAKIHKKNWRVLKTIALCYAIEIPHFGCFFSDGSFRRTFKPYDF